MHDIDLNTAVCLDAADSLAAVARQAWSVCYWAQSPGDLDSVSTAERAVATSLQLPDQVYARQNCRAAYTTKQVKCSKLVQNIYPRWDQR